MLGILSLPDASERRYAGIYAAHAHAHVQVLVALRGRLEIELAGHLTRLEPGVALIVPALVRHAYSADRAMTALVIDTPVRAGFDRVRRLRCDPAQGLARARDDLHGMLDALSGAPRAGARRPLDLDHLASVVQASLHEPWPVSRLADWAHLSRPRLHARIVERTGVGPQAWVRAFRLDRARVLLAAGCTLYAAASQVGYASASALAYALRRERGVGARELRTGGH
jgi:AraC-like DNA-binding protein